MRTEDIRQANVKQKSDFLFQYLLTDLFMPLFATLVFSLQLQLCSCVGSYVDLHPA